MCSKQFFGARYHQPAIFGIKSWCSVCCQFCSRIKRNFVRIELRIYLLEIQVIDYNLMIYLFQIETLVSQTTYQRTLLFQEFIHQHLHWGMQLNYNDFYEKTKLLKFILI